MKAMQEYQVRQLRAFSLKIPDPMKAMREYQERQLKALTKSFPDPMKTIWDYQQSQAKTLFLRYQSPAEEMQKYQERFLELYRESNQIRDEQIESTETGAISIDGEVAHPSKVKCELVEISENSSNPDEFFQNLCEWLAGSSKVVQWIVLNILLSYFVSVIAGMHTPFWIGVLNDYSKLPKRSIKKEIISEGQEFFTYEQLAPYRFVTASSLRVRETGSTKSLQMDSLAFGTIVKLEEKSKDWSFVAYMDTDTQDIKTGWVFTRYLEKLNK